MSFTRTTLSRVVAFGKSPTRLTAVLTLLFMTVVMSFSASAQTTFENPPFTLGNINQNGWSNAGTAGLGCANYDHLIHSNTGAPVSFAAQSLRISDSVTSSCFDGTFSASLSNEAGETSAANNGMSGGVRQTHFEFQFSLASAVSGAEQNGLAMSVSPDRGDGARMSYLRFEDKPAGIDVYFNDYIDAAPFGGAISGPNDALGCGVEDDFTSNIIATISRTAPHTIKFVMDFVDGARNDVVKIYIDGVLIKTGTSWEDYFRYCEGNPTRTVDSLGIFTRGTAHPANAGKGFLIDNVSSLSSSTLLVDDNATECPTAAYSTIQSAVNAANPNDTIQVCGGTYNEDVSITKNGISLLGAGAAVTTIRGPKNGPVSTIQVAANNVTVAGFTITRDGNNVADWNDANGALNSIGIGINGQPYTGLLVRDNIITGNRNGIDINNSNGHTIRNNVIDNNRTGVFFRNQTDNITMVENTITNNWTLGVLFLDSSAGTNTPPQTAANGVFSNNNISGNWYAEVNDRQTGGSLPAPNTTNLKNFKGNWFGTTAPVVTTANSTEPGYAGQIPVAYGGTATAPGGQPDIAGPASANIKYMPLLTSGTDTNVETTPGRGTFGFQGAASVITVKSSTLNGWSTVSQRTAAGSFVGGPAAPPLGVGSYRMTTGAGNSGPDLPQTGAGQGGKTWITTQQYDNTLLSGITQLGYSTYVAASPASAGNIITPTLQFQVDLDGNGTRDSAMIFEPYYSTVASGGTQPNVALGQWQTWNARAGKWWFNNATVFGCGQCAFPTFDAIIAAYPNAKIVTWYALTDGYGTQFVAGMNSAGAPWTNFDGNIDAFTITVNAPNTTFDFEPENPTVTINQAAGQADPTGASPINFTVVFSEPVTGFGNSPSDVILSGTAGATTAVVTGSGTTYNVAVSGMIADGTVIAAIAAGAAQSSATTAPNTASTSTDNTVNYFLPRTISGQILKNGSPLQGVSVALTGSAAANTVTDASGNYTFANLPYNGSYLITPTFAGHTFEPINRSYTNLTVSVTNANFTATAGASPRIVRVVNGYTTPGQNVTVPIELVSQGNENSVGFSLTYNSSLIFNPIVALGADATGGSLVVNNLTAGQIGILVALPSNQAFAAGTRQLVTVTFNTAANMASNTPVNFSGAPVIRRVASPNADPLPATFTDGFVVFSQGYEGDVTNRFTGNGMIDVTDFTQVGNFVAGVDTVNPNYNEFERADCAPRGSKGDGSLDVTDFTQAGRYAAGLDAYQTAGGPTIPSLFLFNRGGTNKEGSKDALLLPRIVRVVNNTGSAGQQVTVSIEIDAEGDEAGVGFTLSYDSSKLSNPFVQLGTGTQGAALIPNTMTSGKVGVVLSYFGGPTIQAGTRQVVTVRFNIALNALPGQTPLSFTGFPPVFNSVSSAAATPLTTTFADGFVNILGPTAASVSIAGQVLTATGQNVSNAKVFLTSGQGMKRAAISNGFGYYSFEGVTVGETYILIVDSKRYTFTPRAVNVNEELTALNLIAEP